MARTDDAIQQLIDYLQQSAEGSHQAFSKLYQATSANLYSLCLRTLRNEALAQECLQDAYVKIWHKADRYDPALASPFTWLAAITRNQAIDTLRRHKPEVSIEDIEEIVGLDDVSVPIENSQAGLLDKCMQELKSEPRQALYMAYFHGLTHPELAQYLQQPLGTIKTWIRRALQHMRECLDR